MAGLVTKSLKRKNTNYNSFHGGDETFGMPKQELNLLVDQIVHNQGYKSFIGDGLKKQVERLLVWSGGVPELGLDFYYNKF